MKKILSLIMAVLLMCLSMVCVSAEDSIIIDEDIDFWENDIAVREPEETIENVDNIGNNEEIMPMAAGGCTSVNQMQQMVLRDQAPAGIVAVHGVHITGGKPHIHFETGALNYDGTVHDGVAPKLTNAQRKWITSNGWSVGDY